MTTSNQLLCLLILAAGMRLPVTTGTPNNCQVDVDLGFILDGSGSIRLANPPDGSYDNWNLLMQAVATVIDQLPRTGSKVGAVLFSDRGELLFHLDSDLDAARHAILNTRFTGGNTNISGGLYRAHVDLFNPRYGDRPHVPNVAIVMTDGKSTFDPHLTISTAEALRREGVIVLVLGITDSVDENELRAISSPPQQLDVTYFTTLDFRQVQGVLESIMSSVCLTTTRPPPSPDQNPSTSRPSPTNVSPTVPLTVGAVAAALTFVIIIIIVVCVCVRREKNKVNDGTDAGLTQTGVAPRHNLYLIDTGSYLHPPQHEEPAEHLHQQDTGSYLDILDTGVYLHAPEDEQSIKSAPAVSSGDSRYEPLISSLSADTSLGKLFRDRGIPTKLRPHGVVTLQHLQDMSRTDMVEAGLNVGDRNRIKRALKDATNSQY